MSVNFEKRRPTRDHIRPKSRFKHERDFRCIVVCSECNYMKGDRTIEEFIDELQVKNVIFQEAIRLNEERLAHLEYLSTMGLA